MKKSLLALAVLTAATGVAQAASSVTLYGKVEAAYQNKGHDSKSVMQDSGGESRLGFKGREDLGNGMAAFFQLEAQVAADTGALNNTDGMFNEKSLVGLSFANDTHKIYFGRSASPIDRIGFSTDHLSSGLGWKSSAGNWQNAAFYDYSSNGFSVAAGVTTKGGLAGNTTEGTKGTKAAYGLSAKYEASNWALAAGYQKDNSTVKSEWGVGGKYTFNPVTVALSYADAKLATNAKERRYHATISAALTSNDTLFANYLKDKTKLAGASIANKTHFGLGYIHALSKRTELFANVGREKDSVASTKATNWDVGMRHSF